MCSDVSVRIGKNHGRHGGVYNVSLSVTQQAGLIFHACVRRVPPKTKRASEFKHTRMHADAVRRLGGGNQCKRPSATDPSPRSLLAVGKVFYSLFTAHPYNNKLFIINIWSTCLSHKVSWFLCLSWL